ncbi:MAG: hypothetical protein BWY87_01563 [Deltaproteobacteria bacterium ADurb.Bin510]|nr:MAG: hypothetical protein BWY87_01563 [Deltaproteobacteria bacterium ADurb.Bin510]
MQAVVVVEREVDGCGPLDFVLVAEPVEPGVFQGRGGEARAQAFEQRAGQIDLGEAQVAGGLDQTLAQASLYQRVHDQGLLDGGSLEQRCELAVLAQVLHDLDLHAGGGKLGQNGVDQQARAGAGGARDDHDLRRHALIII